MSFVARGSSTVLRNVGNSWHLIKQAGRPVDYHVKHYVSLANQATESPLGHYRRNLRRSTSESPGSWSVPPNQAPDRTERTEVQVVLVWSRCNPSQNRQLDILPTLLNWLGVHRHHIEPHDTSSRDTAITAIQVLALPGESLDCCYSISLRESLTLHKLRLQLPLQLQLPLIPRGRPP